MFFLNMKSFLESIDNIWRSFCGAITTTLSQRIINRTIIDTRIKKNQDIFSPITGIDPFVLFHLCIRLFILYQQKKGIATDILQLEFELTFSISLRLALNGTDDPYDGINRNNRFLRSRNKARNLGNRF